MGTVPDISKSWKVPFSTNKTLKLNGFEYRFLISCAITDKNFESKFGVAGHSQLMIKLLRVRG